MLGTADELGTVELRLEVEPWLDEGLPVEVLCTEEELGKTEVVDELDELGTRDELYVELCTIAEDELDPTYVLDDDD